MKEGLIISRDSTGTDIGNFGMEPEPFKTSALLLEGVRFSGPP